MSNSNGGPSKKGAQKQASKGKSSMGKMHPGNAGVGRLTQQMQQGGGGSPLDGDLKAQMEGAFQTDFSGVRIHTDANADQMSRSIKAKAFTRGEDVYFKQGQFDPSSQRGKEILGHELSHVVQQRQGRAQETTQAFGAPVSADPELEREADRQGIAAAEGKTAVSGSGAPAGGGAGGREVIQRSGDPEVNYTYTREEYDAEDVEKFREKKEWEMEWGMENYYDEMTPALYLEEMSFLERNVNAVFQVTKDGFRTQMLAYRQAENNMKSVIDYANKQAQKTAALFNIFLTVLTGVGGGLISGMMANVAGKIGGNKVGSFLKLGTEGTKVLNESIAGGVIDGMKSVVGLAANPKEVPGDSGFQDADSVKDNGLKIIDGEWADFRELIQELQNKMYENIRNGVSPGRILLEHREELARKQAAGKSAQAGSNTKDIERAMWESWVSANGADYPDHSLFPVNTYELGLEPTFDVNKHIIEHLKEKLGVSENTIKAWAGFNSEGKWIQNKFGGMI